MSLCSFHDRPCLQPASSVREQSKLRSASTRLVDIPTRCLAGELLSLQVRMRRITVILQMVTKAKRDEVISPRPHKI